MNKTRYSATEFGRNKPMNFRPSGTLNWSIFYLAVKDSVKNNHGCNLNSPDGTLMKLSIPRRGCPTKFAIC